MYSDKETMNIKYVNKDTDDIGVDIHLERAA